MSDQDKAERIADTIWDTFRFSDGNLSAANQGYRDKMVEAIRAYGADQARTAIAALRCGSCDGPYPNDGCGHAQNAAYANEPRPCHPALPASPEVPAPKPEDKA